MNSITSLKPSARSAFLTVIISLVVLSAQSSSSFALVTAATSTVPQDRLYAIWAQTHSGNNLHEVNTYPNAGRNGKLNCDVSHNAATNINTVSGCRLR